MDMLYFLFPSLPSNIQKHTQDEKAHPAKAQIGFICDFDRPWVHVFYFIFHFPPASFVL
jgi:hypothetical protein